MWVVASHVHPMVVAQHNCRQGKIVRIFEELVKQFVRPHGICHNELYIFNCVV
jgi:hypothetical protein